jgi:exonuclease SbcC
VKLVSIELENLNSLYGPHRVDLETDLRDAPLFLIVGPTGSGKSTLVDAVSLALFGATARLAHPTSTSGDPWDLPNDPRQIVSRGTARGWARVVFEKTEGGHATRYRALWECHRSRQQIDGALQKPRRSLDVRDDVSGAWVQRVSSDKNKEFGPHFERALDGLTIDDFHRCMVLPQGEFAAFLHAAPDERSAILERLTDTAAYKRYGERANEKRQASQRHFDELVAQRTGIDAPDDTVIATMRAEESALAEALRARRADARDLAAAQAWFATDRTLRARHADAVRACEAIARERVERGADLERLEAHERCAEARARWRLVEQRRAARLAGERTRDEAHARRAGLAEALREADERAAVVDAELARAVSARDAKTSEIAAARAAWSRWRVAEDAARRAREAAIVEARTWEQREAARVVAVDAERVASSRAAEAEAIIAKLGADGQIANERGAWQARAEALERDRDAIARQRRNLDALDGRVRERASRRERLVAERARCENAVSDAGRTRDAAAARLSRALDGVADVPSWQAHADRAMRAMRERAAGFDAALRAHESASALTERIGELRTVRARLERAQAEALVAANDARTRRADRERSIELIRARREEIAFAIGLGRERHRLREGEPCPLCGSSDHPYAHDHERARIAEELVRRSARLDEELAEQLGRRDAAAADLETAQARATESRSRIEAIDDECARLECERAAADRVLDELCTAKSVPRDEAALARARDALNECSVQLEAKRAELDLADRAAREASDSLHAAEVALRECEAARASLDEIDRNESVQALAWRDEIALAAVRADSDERALVDAMAKAGIEAATIADGLRAADARTAAFEAARVARDGAMRSLELARMHASRATELAAEANAAQMRAEETARALEAEEREALRLRDALLDGADPDRLQRALQNEVDAAAASQRMAHEQRRELTVRAADAESWWRAALATVEAQVAEVAAAEEAFEGARARLGIDLDALVASGLDDATRVPLEAWRLSLDRRDAESRARRDDRASELARHANERRAEWTALDAEGIDALVAAIELDVQRREHELGALRARLEDALARRERTRVLDAEIAEAREALDVWKRLHDLIGVRNGDAFRQFAQSLNLDELIAHANEHLARLAPRYRLDRVPARTGDVSLSFAIRDAWHADESRPIATLSGGETFLVSLGLALGLAGMRNVRLPIETLLLDEGFGTLDPDALDTAIDALDGLRERGIAQVGIITHVSALRERIDARVLVEPMSPGRSRVRIESRPRDA